MDILNKMQRVFSKEADQNLQELTEQQAQLREQMMALEQQRMELQEALDTAASKENEKLMKEGQKAIQLALAAAERQQQALSLVKEKNRKKLLEEKEKQFQAMIATHQSNQNTVDETGKKMAHLEGQARQLWTEVSKIFAQERRSREAFETLQSEIRALGGEAPPVPEFPTAMHVGKVIFEQLKEVEIFVNGESCTSILQYVGTRAVLYKNCQQNRAMLQKNAL